MFLILFSVNVLKVYKEYKYKKILINIGILLYLLKIKDYQIFVRSMLNHQIQCGIMYI